MEAAVNMLAGASTWRQLVHCTAYRSHGAPQVWGGTPSNPTRVELDCGSRTLSLRLAASKLRGVRQGTNAHPKKLAHQHLPWRAADVYRPAPAARRPGSSPPRDFLRVWVGAAAGQTY